MNRRSFLSLCTGLPVIGKWIKIAEPAKPFSHWEEDCLEWRGRILTGQYSHWCSDWDDLPIDETCEEWPCGCLEMTVDPPDTGE